MSLCTRETTTEEATPLDGNGQSVPCCQNGAAQAAEAAEAAGAAEAAEAAEALPATCDGRADGHHCLTTKCPLTPPSPTTASGGFSTSAAMRAQLESSARDAETQYIESGGSGGSGGSGDCADGECGSGECGSGKCADGECGSESGECAEDVEVAEDGPGAGPDAAQAEEVDPGLDPDELTVFRSTTSEASSLPRTKRIGAEVHPVPPAGQKIAVVQFAGPTQLTKSHTHTFRLCGVFETDEEADDHIEDLPRVATCKVPMAKSVTFGKKIDMEDGEKQISFISHVLEATRAEVQKSDAEFNEYVARRKTGKETEELNREEQEYLTKERVQKNRTKEELDRCAAKKIKPANDEKLNVVRALKASHAVPNQTHAVVGLMHDPADKDAIKNQWVVTVWGVFGNANDAKAYLSDTIQHEHRYHASFVVKMYQWVFPDETNTPQFQLTVRGVYRYEDQQQMWDASHDNKSEVAAVMKNENERRAKLAAAASSANLDAIAKEIEM